MRIPESVRDVIGKRLNHLSKECNDLLAVASVIGREFGLDVLATLSGVPADRAQELLEEAMSARVVEEATRALGRYRFSHTLIRETLYGELRTPRRILLHRQTAEALETLHGRDLDPHLSALAYHFFEAAHAGGGVDTAIEYVERAGARATELLAYDEAATHYERALELLDLKPPDDQKRCDLLLAHGEALERSGDIPRRNEAFEKAASFARKIEAPEKLARAALGRAGQSGAGIEPIEKSLLKEALDLQGEQDGALRAMLLSRLAGDMSIPLAERDALGRQAIEMARRVGDRAAVAYTLWGWRHAVWDSLSIDERVAASAESSRLAEETGDQNLVRANRLWRIHGLLQFGRIEEADAEIESFVRRAAELRLAVYVWQATVVRASRTILDGRFEEGERLSLEALAIGRRMREPSASLTCGGQLFQLRWDQGRLEEMKAPLVRAVQRYPKFAPLECNLAFLHAEIGREGEAREAFEELAADEFGELRRQAGWMLSACWLAETCACLQDARRASTLYDLLLPYAGRVHVIGSANSCTGSVSRQLGLLAATMSRWEEAARHFEDALEMHARMRARPFLARTRYEYARMLLERGEPGDREKALGLLDQAIEAAQALGMKGVAERALALKPESAGGSEAAATRPPAFAALFRREGDFWTIVYEGKHLRLRDAKGLQYIAHLLRYEGREFHSMELAAGADAETPLERDGEVEVAGLGDAGEVLDPQARSDYRERLESLRAELEEATRWEDSGRAARLGEEIDFLTEELSAAYGVGGRARKAGDIANRARKAVTSRIRETIARIGKEHAALGRHLENAIRTGIYCSYHPDRSPGWSL